MATEEVCQPGCRQFRARSQNYGSELEQYEAGVGIPELQTLSRLKGFVSDYFRAHPDKGTAYSVELAVILEAVLLKLAEVAEKSQAEAKES